MAQTGGVSVPVKSNVSKRFNTGRLPVANEIAIAGGTLDIDLDGFVQKADVKQVRAFAAGASPIDFDIEFFTVATSDLVPATDQYRQYQWQHINTQNIDGAEVPVILEDQELESDGTTAMDQLHVRITNNSAAGTMHIVDMEILFNELITG